MASTSEEKKGGRLRITISKKDLESWGVNDVPQATLREWICAGKEKDAYRERLDDLEDKIDAIMTEQSQLRNEIHNLVLLTSNLAHLMVIASTKDHYELKKVLVNNKNSSATDAKMESEIADLFKVKLSNYRSFIDNLFPGIETKSLTLSKDISKKIGDD